MNIKIKVSMQHLAMGAVITGVVAILLMQLLSKEEQQATVKELGLELEVEDTEVVSQTADEKNTRAEEITKEYESLKRSATLSQETTNEPQILMEPVALEIDIESIDKLHTRISKILAVPINTQIVNNATLATQSLNRELDEIILDNQVQQVPEVEQPIAQVQSASEAALSVSPLTPRVYTDIQQGSGITQSEIDDLFNQ